MCCRKQKVRATPPFQSAPPPRATQGTLDPAPLPTSSAQINASARLHPPCGNGEIPQGWGTQPHGTLLQQGKVCLVRTSEGPPLESWSVYNTLHNLTFECTLVFEKGSVISKGAERNTVVVSPGETVQVAEVMLCKGYTLSCVSTPHRADYVTTRRTLQYRVMGPEAAVHDIGLSFHDRPVWMLPGGEYHKGETPRPWDNACLLQALQKLPRPLLQRVSAVQTEEHRPHEYCVWLFVRGCWGQRTVDDFIPCVDNETLCTTDLTHKAVADVLGGFEESQRVCQHEDIIYTLLTGHTKLSYAEKFPREMRLLVSFHSGYPNVLVRVVPTIDTEACVSLFHCGGTLSPLSLLISEPCDANTTYVQTSKEFSCIIFYENVPGIEVAVKFQKGSTYYILPRTTPSDSAAATTFASSSFTTTLGLCVPNAECLGVTFHEVPRDIPVLLGNDAAGYILPQGTPGTVEVPLWKDREKLSPSCKVSV